MQMQLLENYKSGCEFTIHLDAEGPKRSSLVLGVVTTANLDCGWEAQTIHVSEKQVNWLYCLLASKGWLPFLARVSEVLQK